MTPLDEVDVVVVGAGLAGLTAGLRAREAGTRVLIVEKTAMEPGWNSSLIASGFFHLTHADLESDPEFLYQRVLEETDGAARPELARALVDATPPTLKWLQDQGVQFGRWGSGRIWFTEPSGFYRKGLSWEGLGMERALDRVFRAFLEAGGTYRNGTRVSELIAREGAVVGALLENGDGMREEVYAQAVVLADGGFQGNPEMVRRYISPAPERVKLRAVDTASGDGIRMAQKLGAKCVHMPYFYGHCLHRESMRGDELWPYPTLDTLMATGIVVDRGGQRIVDEGGGGVFMANALARRQDPQDAWVAFDRTIWEGPGASDTVAPNPVLLEKGASVYRADSLSALGDAIEIDPYRLETTVEEYNRAVHAGQTHLLPVPRTISTKQPLPNEISHDQPLPIETPPFYAIPVVPGITHTMGGLLISPSAEVLNGSEMPIPGLYAAGATVGGLDGGPRAGYVGGLHQAAVWGLIAGETAANQALS